MKMRGNVATAVSSASTWSDRTYAVAAVRISRDLYGSGLCVEFVTRQCFTTSFSAPSTYRVCGSQSSSTSGLLYSYGPWWTTGTFSKLPWGGGVGASFHSSVVASHRFCGALAPQIQLPMKLFATGICASPSANALQVLKMFMSAYCAKLW